MADTDVGGIKATLRLDLDPWDASIERAKSDVADLKGSSADVKVTADTDRAVEELSAVEATVKELDTQSATVEVRVEETGGGTGSADAAAASQEELAGSTRAAALAAEASAAANEALAAAQASDAAAAESLAAAQRQLQVIEAELAASRGEDVAVTAAAAAANTAEGESVAELTAQLAALDAQTEALAASKAQGAAAILGERAALQAEADAALEDAAAQDALGAATKSSGDAAAASGGQTELIVAAIGAAFAVAGPAAAAVVGLGGALGGMGLAGAAAVYGIDQAMKEGNQTGQAYSTGLQSLKSDLDGLAATAAVSMLDSFQSAQQEISADMPALNMEVSSLAGILGQSGDALIDGALKGLQVLNPLINEGAQYIESLAQGFDNWTNDGGLQKFATYAEAELPRVEQAASSLGRALVEMAEDAAPLGDEILDAANGLGKFIDEASQVTKGTDEFDKLTKSFSGGVPILSTLANAAKDTINPFSELADEIKPLQPLIDKWTGASKASTTQSNAAAQAVAAQTSALNDLAGTYGASAGEYSTAAQAAAKQTQQTKAATLAEQLENDALDLLTNSITLANGGTLSLAEAQTGFASATNSLTSSLKTNGTTINGNSAAAVANQQAVQQAVSAAQSMAEAQAKATGSTVAGTKSLQASKAELEQQFPTLKTYIDQIFSIPPTKATKLDLQNAAAAAALTAYKASLASTPREINTSITVSGIAAAASQIAAISGELNNINTNADDAARKVHGISAGAETAPGKSHGGPIEQHFATGGVSGSVWGSAGSGTSDSIVTALSVGETVTNQYASAYPGVAPLLSAINSDPKGTMQALEQGQSSRPSSRPIYMDGTLFGVLREMANGEAQIVVNAASARRKASLLAGRQNASY